MLSIERGFLSLKATTSQLPPPMSISIPSSSVKSTNLTASNPACASSFSLNICKSMPKVFFTVVKISPQLSSFLKLAVAKKYLTVTLFESIIPSKSLSNSISRSIPSCVSALSSLYVAVIDSLLSESMNSSLPFSSSIILNDITFDPKSTIPYKS